MTITPEMEKETARIRGNIREMLHDAQLQSKKSGKPLAILIGESHADTHSEFLELLIMNEAKKIGINNLAVEYPENYYELGISNSRNTTAANLYASAEKWQVHEVDALYHQAKRHNGNLLEARNQNMASNLSHINQSFISVIGTDHLKGMSADKNLLATHSVLSLDVTRKNMPLFLTVSFNIRDLDVQEIITLALGSEDAKKMISYCESKGLIEIPEKMNDKDYLFWKKQLEEAKYNIIDLWGIANTLYDSNEFSAAGQISASAVRLFRQRSTNTASEIEVISHILAEKNISIEITKMLFIKKSLRYTHKFPQITHV